MSKATDDAPKLLHRLYPIVHDIEPLLDYETFTLAETPAGGTAGDVQEVKGALEKCLQAGVLKKVERVRENGGADSTSPKLRWRYRWADGARAAFQEYLDDVDTLPCQCRKHIPDSRDDPPGIISCKHCGHEYDEERFRELVLG